MEKPQTQRQQRIASQIMKDVADIIREKGMAFFSGAMVTVSGVKMSPDLADAKVFVSIFPSDKSTTVMPLLEENAKNIRGELGKRIAKQMRIVPSLTFIQETSLDYVAKIDELLKK